MCPFKPPFWSDILQIWSDIRHFGFSLRHNPIAYMKCYKKFFGSQCVIGQFQIRRPFLKEKAFDSIINGTNSINSYSIKCGIKCGLNKTFKTKTKSSFCLDTMSVHNFDRPTVISKTFHVVRKNLKTLLNFGPRLEYSLDPSRILEMYLSILIAQFLYMKIPSCLRGLRE